MLEQLETIQRLQRDIKTAAITLSDSEARFLVDAYYAMQDNRKRESNQVLALGTSGEPHAVLAWLANQSNTLERQIARALDAYSGSKPIGEWSRSIVGIGPIIAAGLLAYIDLEPWYCRNDEAEKSCRDGEPCSPACGRKRTETVGHIWRFAGLDPTSKWKKGEKRPWNAGLKVLAWKIGESFVKVSGNKDDIYGKVYLQRKEYERVKNEAGDYAAQAAAIVASLPTHKQRKIYETGKLPDGHLHARAKRFAVKLFLAHYHEVAYRQKFGSAPPLPYPIAMLGHAHKIEPPTN